MRIYLYSARPFSGRYAARVHPSYMYIYRFGSIYTSLAPSQDAILLGFTRYIYMHIHIWIYLYQSYPSQGAILLTPEACAGATSLPGFGSTPRLPLLRICISIYPPIPPPLSKCISGYLYTFISIYTSLAPSECATLLAFTRSIYIYIYIYIPIWIYPYMSCPFSGCHSPQVWSVRGSHFAARLWCYAAAPSPLRLSATQFNPIHHIYRYITFTRLSPPVSSLGCRSAHTRSVRGRYLAARLRLHATAPSPSRLAATPSAASS